MIQNIPRAKYCKIRWGEKFPIGKGWQENPYQYEEIEAALALRECGYGIILGFGNLVAIDIDNAPGRDRFLHHFGYLPHKADTVSWTSGKTFEGEWKPETDENTCIQTLWLLTNKQAAQIQGRKVFKGNSLDIRFTGAQSVLPSHSPHPSTGKPYRWHNAPSDCEVAAMPDEVWDSLISELYESQPSADPKIKAERLQQKQARRDGFIGSDNPLVNLLDRDILPRLSLDQIFNWNGHQFKEWRGKLVGCCPQHESKSGTAFQINDGGEWYCHGCMVGGGPVQYRWFARGGTGTPTGKDFVEIVGELASEAGVEMPKLTPPEPPPIGEPDPIEYQQWIENQEEWEAAQDAVAADQLEQWKRAKKEAREVEKAARKEQAYQTYQQLSKLTASNAWMTIHTPNLDSLPELQSLPNGAIYIFVSAKGTAKTQAVIPYIQRANAAYYPTSRKSLGREAGRRIGVVWHTDVGAKNKVAFCINSAWKAEFSPSRLRKNSVLFLDELPELMNHLYGSTCNKDGKRPWILSSLKAMILAAVEDGYVFAASEDITDSDIDYLKELVPDIPIRLILNTYQPQGYDCYFYGENPEYAISSIESELEYSEANLMVFDDFKDGAVGARSLANLMASKIPDLAPHIVEVNADTSGSDDIQSYLTNFNTSPRENETRLCTCTPSVTSGISNTDDWFTSIWGISNGILMPTDISQALLRVRNRTIPRNVCVVEEAPPFMMEGGGAITPEEVDIYFKNNLNANAKLLSGFGLEYDLEQDTWTSPHWRYFCLLVARRNCARLNLRRLTREKLEAEGNTIIDCEGYGGEATLNELQAQWEGIKREDYAAIEAAKLIDDEQFDELKEKDNPSPEEVVQLKKKMLHLSYGQALIDAVGGYAGDPSNPDKPGICELDQKGRWRKQLENLYLLTHLNALEAAARKDEGKLRSQLRHEMGYFPSDQSWHTRRVKALQVIGIQPFLERRSADKAWTSEDTKEICSRKNKRAKTYSEALGVKVDDLGGNKLVGTLLELLGLKTANIQVREGEKRTRKYWIDPRSWELAGLYIQHREAQQKATSTCHTPSVNIYESCFSQGVCDTPEASVGNTSSDLSPDVELTNAICHEPSTTVCDSDPWQDPENIEEVSGWLSLAPDQATFNQILALGISPAALKLALQRLAQDVRERCLGWLGWGPDWQLVGSG